jgi:NAD+ kinase
MIDYLCEQALLFTKDHLSIGETLMVTCEDAVLEDNINSDQVSKKETTPFRKVALFGRQRVEGIEETLLAVRDYLANIPIEVVLEPDTAELIPDADLPVFSKDLICKNCDLLIVVGGDGSMLNAAHIAINYGLPVLGINRGRLGFLTDIRPDELYKVNEVLAGRYIEENRFLLQAEIEMTDQVKKMIALNDVVLLPGNIAHMIEFEVRINNQVICTQRADGIIVATPTGSTAYALSGGGPILHPQLDAIVLVPMFPHTLSSRPIVVKSDSEITIHLSAQTEVSPRVSCDGQERIPLAAGGIIKIKKNPKTLRLIHPLDYNYYQTLREKLGWEK